MLCLLNENTKTETVTVKAMYWGPQRAILTQKLLKCSKLSHNNNCLLSWRPEGPKQSHMWKDCTSTAYIRTKEVVARAYCRNLELLDRWTQWQEDVHKTTNNWKKQQQHQLHLYELFTFWANFMSITTNVFIMQHIPHHQTFCHLEVEEARERVRIPLEYCLMKAWKITSLLSKAKKSDLVTLKLL